MARTIGSQMSRPLLTIGMATIDDFDGVYFTVTSLMIHHADIMSNCEIVVVDNNPSSQHGQELRKWIRQRVPNGSYIPFDGPTGTAQARNEVFRQAKGQAVLCVDCHVLLVPGAVRKLIEYYLDQANCPDLLCGPLIKESGQLGATHQRPEWRGGALGVWCLDDRGSDLDGKPFEIWQQGMGLFSCRKEAWVGFHPEFRGFGGCETYIMEKFRKNGGRVLCCPWLRWTHRFHRPAGVPYRVDRRDRIRNYVVGFRELGIEIEPVLEHFGVSHKVAPRTDSACYQADSAGEFAVVGDQRFGGVRMRGRSLSKQLQGKLYTPLQVQDLAHHSTIVAIKNIVSPKLIRQKCDRLIYDPLDDFFTLRINVDPVKYWRSRYQELRFDEIIASSPACYDVMRAALPNEVIVHLVPHQCDARIDKSWRNPNGPVAYAGLKRFIEPGLDRIETACRMVGKQFNMGKTCDVLKGASLAIALRLPPHDTALNRRCKPQIKIENAIAAGMPIVSTDCPAAVSLHPEIQTVPTDFSAATLADAMCTALSGPQQTEPYTDARYLEAMSRILRRQTVVVYTAIFGGYDELREPRERTAGVQYVCFTDNPNLRSNLWQVRYCQPTGDPLLQSKRVKILAHETLRCDISLWIDGRIELCNLNGAVEQFSKELALRRHPQRDCIYAEAAHCQNMGRGDPGRIAQAVARYKQAGHPSAYGLWMGGVVLRRHTPSVAAFNRLWWQEVISGTSRDQIILPVILRRLGIPVQTLSAAAPIVRIGSHLT